ncbi:MAG TPA: hybrid sensor histidine kinase/response regulator [Cyanobacteria bacterium UBA11149]|nr:hybrid sensor histidine kinase/response regulator [Cyanobacteria bacterium UBA11367]HBE56572.1 hybrid sensor histidine kinase/response regulator [Cyanobacteria bacterium UBA11366]HBK63916.1 hybrid sensor histidine kinase/response regulator [Cyanobacteria bacterium UBA11166]HBR74517.1 hybrid sensor histidine kinase/response regulator [Cyanobacteria bacterium UBA11159]HBS72548.1 hybrid sensor histidine kinase/response regulator [Cyanobacteria bacterium UBA11153]HBW87832.1 hybrid sensor histid
MKQVNISEEILIRPKGNILAVDDTPANLQLLTEMLSQAGYKARIIPDAALVVKSVTTNPPDLILLDILMPEMDGYQVCQALKANPKTKDIPIIFISALSEGFDKVKAFALGGVDYITKPFLAEEVMARVENQLRLKAQENQLRENSKQLELTVKELQATQAQLIQTEKMLSLGQMVAGVAHEINNPINFISGNIGYARQYFQDLMRLVELYQQTYPNPTPEIQDLSEEIELDFLGKDWFDLTNSMEVGAKRIEKIVASLRLFSRLDESPLKAVDLNESIEIALFFLQHRLKPIGNKCQIKIIKNYGKLPKITCYASQLNQVFSHLINNAIDALEEKGGEIPTLTISTELKHQDNHENLAYAVIKISDNGLGMSEDILAQIFDPFFSTKPVGSGTGLGLSICHQIVVEKHKGKISCVSIPGQGTEFIAEIPSTVERSFVHSHQNNQPGKNKGCRNIQNP